MIYIILRMTYPTSNIDGGLLFNIFIEILTIRETRWPPEVNDWFNFVDSAWLSCSGPSNLSRQALENPFATPLREDTS